MDKEKCFYLGKVTRVIGFKGEVVVFVDSDEPENYSQLDAVFLDIGKKLIPFFIDSIVPRNKNNQFTVKFQDVDSSGEAETITGRDLYLPLDVLPPLEDNNFYFWEVKQFKVIDEHKGDIGTINQIQDYPGNPLFEIQHGSKQILIPVKDDFIKKVDRKNKTIFIDAPPGLIDIYLEED